MSQPASLPVATQPGSDIVAQIALLINQASGHTDVPRLVVEKAVKALGASSGSVMLPASDGGGMRVVAAVGAGGEQTPRPESPVAEWVVQNDEPMLLLGRTGPLAHLLKRDDIRDAVCVPLRYTGSVIGALSVNNSVGREPFTTRDVELLTTIGHVAAVALKNTMLFEEAERRKQQLQEVLRQLWTTQEDERKRLAEDLHDGPAQGLFHIVFQLQIAKNQSDPKVTARHISQAETAARETLSQVRAIMSGLRPMTLDDLGLVSALKAECACIEGRGRLSVDTKISGVPRRFDRGLETALFRMTREALSNVERHADCQTADLDIAFGEDGVTVTVTDRGKGFTCDTALAARAKGRMGLTALQERAEALGIGVRVDSRIGHGTRIQMTCPWRVEN
jgi:signal transduction histidine kinase